MKWWKYNCEMVCFYILNKRHEKFSNASNVHRSRYSSRIATPLFHFEKKTDSMKRIFCCRLYYGTSKPEVQAELNKSPREPLTLLLGRAFSDLKLKNKPFGIFKPSSKETIEEVLFSCRHGRWFTSANRYDSHTSGKEEKKYGFLANVKDTIRSSSKSVVYTCQVCKFPKLPADIFSTLKYIPYPMLEVIWDNNHRDAPTINEQTT